MQVGFGVVQGADGKHYATLMVQDGNVNIQAAFTDDENYTTDIPALIAGLQQITADLRQAKSGIVIAKEVPNGSLRPAKGRG